MGAMIAGWATAEGTARYRGRFGTLAAGHFRELQGARLSTLGLGTYLGRDDAVTDTLYQKAVERALERGVNVLDTVDQLSQPAERAGGGRGPGGGDRAGGPRDATRSRHHQGRLSRLRQQRARRPARVLHDDLRALRHHPAGRHRRLALHDPALSPRSDRSQPRQPRAGDDRRLLRAQSRDAAGRGEPGEVPRAASARRSPRSRKRPGRASCGCTAPPPGTVSGPIPTARATCRSPTSSQAARDVGGADHHFRVIQLPYNLAMPEAFTRANQRWTAGSSACSTCRPAPRRVRDGLRLRDQGQLTQKLPPSWRRCCRASRPTPSGRSSSCARRRASAPRWSA